MTTGTTAGPHRSATPRGSGSNTATTTVPASRRRAPSRRRRLATHSHIGARVGRVCVPMLVLGGLLLAAAGAPTPDRNTDTAAGAPAGTEAASAIQLVDNCRTAPEPDDPRDGVAAMLDPSMIKVQLANSHYGLHGYAGLFWATYDLGCLPPGDPLATIDTLVGNGELSIATDSVAAYDGLNSLATGVDLTATDTAAGQTAKALFEALFSPWVGAALTVAAVLILLAAGRADTAAVLTRGGVALASLGIATLALGGGAGLSADLSDTLRNAILDAQVKVADVLGYDPVSGPRDAIFDGLLWRSWAIGEVGTHDPGDTLATQLYTDQALTKTESDQVEQDPGAASDFLNEISANWRKAADGAQSSNPLVYHSIQGKAHSRSGAGLRALLLIAPICWFQILALLLVLTMLVFVALLPVAAPLAALAGIVSPGALEKTVKLSLGVILAGMTGAVCSIVQIALVTKLLTTGPAASIPSETQTWTATLIVFGVTIALLGFLKPITAIKGLLGATVVGPLRTVGAGLSFYQRMHYYTGRASRDLRGSARLGELVRHSLRGDRPPRPRPAGGPSGGAGPSGGGGPRPGPAPRSGPHRGTGASGGSRPGHSPGPSTDDPPAQPLGTNRPSRPRPATASTTSSTAGGGAGGGSGASSDAASSQWPRPVLRPFVVPSPASTGGGWASSVTPGTLYWPAPPPAPPARPVPARPTPRPIPGHTPGGADPTSRPSPRPRPDSPGTPR
jgi:hypothetical protein